MKVILTQTQRANLWNLWFLFEDGSSFTDNYVSAQTAWRIAWREHRNSGAEIEVVPYC